MPAAKKSLNEKRAEQADLKRLNLITVTLVASEENLMRIAALLTFATVPYEVQMSKPLGPLPWEDPTDPRFQQPPVLEIDYNAVRNDIMKEMSVWLDGGGPRDVIVAWIVQHGGTKLTDVPNDNLLPLLADLQRLNPKVPA